jgi:hypothetical protein
VKYVTHHRTACRLNNLVLLTLYGYVMVFEGCVGERYGVMKCIYKHVTFVFLEKSLRHYTGRQNIEERCAHWNYTDDKIET